MGAQFNCQKHFLFQAIQFSQTILILIVQFSVSTVFAYTVKCQKQFYFKQFSLAQVRSLHVKTVLY